MSTGHVRRMDELQEGEAPEEIGAVLQQRSRWAKGHMQVLAKHFHLRQHINANATACCSLQNQLGAGLLIMQTSLIRL